MIILSSVVPRFWSSLSLTHYCSYPWLWLLRPDDQTDIPHHKISNCNCPNFCCFILSLVGKSLLEACPHTLLVSRCWYTLPEACGQDTLLVMDIPEACGIERTLLVACVISEACHFAPSLLVSISAVSY